MNEKKRKISTCVFVHSILHHWVCILMFEGHLIMYVCLWEFVCELSKALYFLYSFCRVFWEWGEWLSLRSSVSLSFPSLHSLTMWLHFMLDSSGSSLLFVFFVSPSFSFLLLIHPFHFTPCSFLTATHFQVCYSLCIIITYLIISLFFFITSLLLSYSHWAPSGPWLPRFSVHAAFHTWGHGFFYHWVFKSIFPSFLLPYHPITLAYVTSRVLRPPWGHGIKCLLRQPLLGRVFEILLIFRYRHASYFGSRLFDV